jgi:hypothetical protein
MASIYDVAEYILELDNKPSCADLNASMDQALRDFFPELVNA